MDTSGTWPSGSRSDGDSQASMMIVSALDAVCISYAPANGSGTALRRCLCSFSLRNSWIICTYTVQLRTQAYIDFMIGIQATFRSTVLYQEREDSPRRRGHRCSTILRTRGISRFVHQVTVLVTPNWDGKDQATVSRGSRYRNCIERQISWDGPVLLRVMYRHHARRTW